MYKSLQNPLCAFTPPHHQGSHDQGDQHRHADERGEDAVRRFLEEASGHSTVVEVDPVDVHEEAVDYLIRPEAVHPQGHLVGAVCQSLVDPAEGNNTQSDLLK